jgi:GR25 family glycosyltransferase involved in LPS biosynthesis
MLHHLDSLSRGDASHFIVCEDDIYLSKTFTSDLPQVIDIYTNLKLDVLLLSYLLPYKPSDTDSSFILKSGKFSIHSFGDDLWGSQMYLVSKDVAKKMVDLYTIEFAMENITKIPFSADWTLTKFGNRALITPMLAVEEGNVKTDHHGQVTFHLNCVRCNYDPDLYV